MKQLLVIKKIRKGRHTVAKVGTILNAVKDYSRIGGVEILQKEGGKYICDNNSLMAKEHCVLIR